MTDAQQREAARQFFYRWQNKGNEKQDASSYWVEILQDILGVSDVTQRVEFEKPVVGPDGNTKYIDVYIPETHVLIEQKSLGIPLDKPQAGHSGMTPYEQAKMYDNGLPFAEKVRWIITSNFAEIWVYDMNRKKPEGEIIKLALADLQTKFHILDFLVNRDQKNVTQEMEVSLKAGQIVGELYDAFRRQYKDPDATESLASLNKLCVRLVFCLYAEDDGVFGKKGLFHDYMAQFDAQHARKGLRDLFRVLDQKPEDRDEFLADDDPILAAFPYVNGGLFGGDDITIPPFTDEIMDLLLNKASADFDWSGISGPIFGAVFESTLNQETRRAGGMHYTATENLHKVIDPLFLDSLKEELDEIKKIDVWKTKKQKLETFQDKLASLYFLDPAVGSGNFLTLTYAELRTLENEVIRLLTRGQMSFGEAINPIKVSIGQFAGIEINDFATVVARTALWIVENQMLRRTEDIVQMDLDFLPLKTNANIVEGNALEINWNDVVPNTKLTYLLGNPPFVGARLMSRNQKADVNRLFAGFKNAGDLDYVACWYKKASDYIAGTGIRCALVSTNSITQGVAVPTLWKPLFEEGIHIDFAYRTFRWDSEATIKAHVHCVIVGFSKAEKNGDKILFSEEGTKEHVKNINGYLLDAEDVFVSSRSTPLCDVPKIGIGNQPIDDGNYLFSKEDMEAFIKKEPSSKKWFKPWYGSQEFINRKPRYCLWLGDCPPNELKKMPQCMKRVEAVRAFRAASRRSSTKKLAQYPTRFQTENMPKGTYIVIPEVSSERRRYVPMGFMTPDILCSNLVKVMPHATIYHFGILQSNVHMSWMRAVAGRLEMRYRYSKDIVYNNFPWPNPTPEQKERIEKTAQGILDARAIYPDSSLADLYDPLTMPPELRKAHQKNDAAVMQAYGMPIKETDEAACVAWLMRLYQEKVQATSK